MWFWEKFHMRATRGEEEMKHKEEVQEVENSMVLPQDTPGVTIQGIRDGRKRNRGARVYR